MGEEVSVATPAGSTGQPGIFKRLVSRVRSSGNNDALPTQPPSPPPVTPRRRGTATSLASDMAEADAKLSKWRSNATNTTSSSSSTSTTTQQKQQQQQQQLRIGYSRSGYVVPKKKSISSATANTKAETNLSRELWDEAYDALRLDPSTSSLVVTYESIISQELPDDLKAVAHSTLSPADGDTQRRIEFMNAITKAGLNKRRGSKTSQVDDMPIVMLEKIKHAVETAWNEYPSAAVAWSGLCVLTPLLIDPILRHDEFYKGIIHVIGRIPWYMHLTQLIQAPSWRDADDFAARQEDLARRRASARDDVLRLYRRVLEFEMNCVCAAASAWNSVARHMVRWNALDKLNEGIREADAKVRELVEDQVVEGPMRSRLLAWEADLDVESLMRERARLDEARRMMEEGCGANDGTVD